jgi:hypothetical protein
VVASRGTTSLIGIASSYHRRLSKQTVSSLLVSEWSNKRSTIEFAFPEGTARYLVGTGYNYRSSLLTMRLVA